MASVIQGGIDCDLHPALPGIQSLLPYLNDYWSDQVRRSILLDAKADPRVSTYLLTQEQLFAARRSALQGDLSVTDETIAGLKMQLTGMEESMAGKKQQLAFLKEQLDGMREGT
mgnify:CR=1 FL=1